MKKIISFALSAVLLIGVGCGDVKAAGSEYPDLPVFKNKTDAMEHLGRIAAFAKDASNNPAHRSNAAVAAIELIATGVVTSNIAYGFRNNVDASSPAVTAVINEMCPIAKVDLTNKFHAWKTAAGQHLPHVRAVEDAYKACLAKVPKAPAAYDEAAGNARIAAAIRKAREDAEKTIVRANPVVQEAFAAWLAIDQEGTFNKYASEFEKKAVEDKARSDPKLKKALILGWFNKKENFSVHTQIWKDFFAVYQPQEIDKAVQAARQKAQLVEEQSKAFASGIDPEAERKFQTALRFANDNRNAILTGGIRVPVMKGISLGYEVIKPSQVNPSPGQFEQWVRDNVVAINRGHLVTNIQKNDDSDDEGSDDE